MAQLQLQWGDGRYSTFDNSPEANQYRATTSGVLTEWSRKPVVVDADGKVVEPSALPSIRIDLARLSSAQRRLVQLAQKAGYQIKTT